MAGTEPDKVSRDRMLLQAKATAVFVTRGNMLLLQFYLEICLACATIVLLVTGLVATIGYCVSAAAAVLGGIFGAAIGMICALLSVVYLDKSLKTIMSTINLSFDHPALGIFKWMVTIEKDLRHT